MTSVVTPVVIGHLGRSYGVKGWLKVISCISSKESILNYQPWQFYLDHKWVSAPVKASRWLGNQLIIQLENCDTPEDAKRYAGVKIGADAEKFPPLPEGEYYWSQLMGLTVITCEGVLLGLVDHLLETGANDVLVVVGEKTHLIPYLPGRVIQQVNLAAGQIIADWDADF